MEERVVCAGKGTTTIANKPHSCNPVEEGCTGWVDLE